MSKDIRSFFQVSKVQKKITIEDDDDVIPESPDLLIKKKKKESRNKRVLKDDSDEEIFASKKTNQTETSNKPNSKKKHKTPVKSPLKEVKISDMFGSGPIKRTEPLVKKIKKKSETGIHSDEEFEKSLLEVDAIEELATKEIKSDKTHQKVDKLSSQSTNQNLQMEKSLIKLNGNSVKETEIKSKNVDEIKKEHSEVHRTENGETFRMKDKLDAVAAVFGKNNEKKVDISNKVKKDIKNHDKKETEKSILVNSNSENVSKNDKKRDFSEFVEGDDSVIEIYDDEKPKNKKKKLDKSLNESVLTDEERHERKMHSAALYQKYLNRSGPKHLGAKEIPEGAPDCLHNCAFLLTGVLDSFERDEVTAAIAKYGGCVKNSMSKKVTHLLAGDDAGPAKMAKAQELGIRIIGEDEFLQLIVDTSKQKTNKSEITAIKTEKSPSRKSLNKTKDKTLSASHKRKQSKEKQHEPEKIESSNKNHGVSKKGEIDKHYVNITKSETDTNNGKKATKEEVKSEGNSSDLLKHEINGVKSPTIMTTKASVQPNSIMWVDKYKPQSVKQIIGQHGDASNVKKLINWLTKWYVNRKAKLPKPNPWAKNDDGGYYKAALLSGPPGVGKTTTVSLVCKELGFDMVEFNASDTRSKNLIKEQIGQLLTTTSLAAYGKGHTGHQAVTKKHVLVMDEVDGMAGNEDRGGLQELIMLIKASSVPIICMCNDRNSQKMRSLVNYCYDLRFNRPRVEQIKSAMMSICCKEGIKIPPDALTQLIIASNQDVRQTLNLLSMWAVDTNLNDSERLKKDTSSGKKDIKLGPWEAIRKVFSAQDHKTMTINDKSDLFFYDYSLAPLFVQENYLQVSPHCPIHEVLERISMAAESISSGDLIDARIRRNQAWSLLPMQAMHSSVIPGHILSGHMAGQIQFPGWLGKNSRASKMHRLCQEIHAHTRLSTTGSKSSIFLDYATHIRDAILTPMLKDKTEGIPKALEVLESYHLLREDLESLRDLSLWPGQRDPMILIDSKVKAAMTRTYNKKALALPYAPGAIRKGRARDEGDEGDEYDDEGDEAEDSDPEHDAFIKKKKIDKPTRKASSSQEQPSSSKAKQSSSKDKASSSKKRK